MSQIKSVVHSGYSDHSGRVISVYTRMSRDKDFRKRMNKELAEFRVQAGKRHGYTPSKIPV